MPTVRLQKFAQAIAPRDEAAALLVADYETISPRNQRYIQWKAAKILGD